MTPPDHLVILEMKITLFFIMSIRKKSVSVTLTNSVFKFKYNEFKLKLKFRTKFNKLTKTYRVFQFHTTICLESCLSGKPSTKKCFSQK